MDSLKAPHPHPWGVLAQLLRQGLYAYSWLRRAGTLETAAAALNNYQALTENISRGGQRASWALLVFVWWMFVSLCEHSDSLGSIQWVREFGLEYINPENGYWRRPSCGGSVCLQQANWQASAKTLGTWMKPLKLGISLKESGAH